MTVRRFLLQRTLTQSSATPGRDQRRVRSGSVCLMSINAASAGLLWCPAWPLLRAVPRAARAAAATLMPWSICLRCLSGSPACSGLGSARSTPAACALICWPVCWARCWCCLRRSPLPRWPVCRRRWGWLLRCCLARWQRWRGRAVRSCRDRPTPPRWRWGRCWCRWLPATPAWWCRWR